VENTDEIGIIHLTSDLLEMASNTVMCFFDLILRNDVPHQEIALGIEPLVQSFGVSFHEKASRVDHLCHTLEEKYPFTVLRHSSA